MLSVMSSKLQLELKLKTGSAFLAERIQMEQVADWINLLLGDIGAEVKVAELGSRLLK